MSRATPLRRDQRRRLIVSWSRSASVAGPAAAATPPRSTITEYAPAALPERQPALATLLPTGIGGLAAAAGSILCCMALLVGPSLAEAAYGRPLVTGGGRFDRTIVAARGCLDLKSPGSLATGLGQLLLVTAAAVAWSIRSMRRHRRDDFHGRFRAWGWMTAVLLGAAVAAHVPLGAFVAAFVADATGVAFGPGGLGWWAMVAASAVGGVSLWVALPLHERTGTVIWLALAGAAWAVAITSTWLLGAGRPDVRLVIIGATAWPIGSALACIAMLTAARSVIREVRGEAGQRVRSSGAACEAAARPPVEEAADDTDVATIAAREWAVEPEAAPQDDFIDGSEDTAAAGRRLTKAERKRLKRMARLQHAG